MTVRAFRIGGRKLSRIFSASLQKRNYIAFKNMVSNFPNWIDCLSRYLFETGKYPCTIKIRTAQGLINLTVFGPHDLLTVNEIFNREDYICPKSVKTIVDIGSNIGVSALYFLTRNDFCRVHLYEPVPENIRKMRHNLAPFQNRCIVNEAAVADFAGRTRFAAEPTGRYGSLSQITRQSLEVECLHINKVLQDVLASEKHIDVLKMDTEGFEIPTLAAIKPEYLEKISLIFYETSSGIVTLTKEQINPQAISKLRDK